MDGRSTHFSQPEFSAAACTSLEDSVPGSKGISTASRLENVHKRLETVDQVLNDMRQLEVKGQVLQTMSRTNEAENETGASNEAFESESSDTAVSSLSDSKLDVEELIEMDRGLQHVKWMQTIEAIAEQVT